MTDKQLEEIIESQKSLKDLPNSSLVSQMDILSEEHEKVKQSIIQNTYYLDKLEELYNNIFRTYQQRNNER